MGTLERLAGLLPWLEEALSVDPAPREVRLRVGRPAQLVGDGGARCVGEPLTRDALARTLAALMDFSVHVREDELARGFFTLPDGSRVGLCGRTAAETGRIVGIEGVGSACVRLARQLPGCADALMPHLFGQDGPRSVLLLSSPGMGKTTCLRDAARQLSIAGCAVCVADERHELAACRRGIPTLDLGPCADVMDGGPKARTIPMMLRAMSPRVIVADEIGGPGDAEALADARRCGAAIVATAHGSGFEAMETRPALRLVAPLFDRAILLGDVPGRVKAVREIAASTGNRCDAGM